MSPPHALLTLALCFGLGLGLAPTIRSAHACSCIDTASWRLARAAIIGDGDPVAEEAFWAAEAALEDEGTPSLYLAVEQGQGLLIELERQP
jgi:hypothetical protein